MASAATERASTTFRSSIDHENGLVDRAIFSDQAIYKAELEQIFSRAWLFMCHESQIPNAGDFFQTYMGEEKVIVVRSRDRSVEVMLNACRHRGATVCRAHSGNTPNFICAYHGWTYDLSGNLIGVPGMNELYERKLDRSEWGLKKAAKVSSYRGFIFATLDESAPSLEVFLGNAGRYMIDNLANYGEIEVIPGIIRHRLRANWKLAMENDQDYYHVGITHASALDAWGVARTTVNKNYWDDNVGDLVLGEFGHVQDTIPGHFHANIFPHMCIFTDLLQAVVVRHPKGPAEVEQWYFSFVDKNASEVQKREVIRRNISRLGPTGMIEQDDGENWEFCTEGAASSAMRDVPFNYQMGIGKGEMDDGSAVGFPLLRGGPRTTEEYARWQLRCWAEWMDAESWPALLEKHSNPAVI
ncbi:aromatic ring-hydroxylating oxygenase subunit alpha [Sphingobium estronivorans]|uniref:aromatic ring-hydroxylating oxygenase subunit alpha n=1 Tax=Sphingobium estronivorans TaxID=1577690 RepID=UPI0013C2ECFB|nr:Rieske 2Fe-2S domain-containing protein [Sphingobium estronivorans]